MTKAASADGNGTADAERRYIWRTESIAKLAAARQQRRLELERRETVIKRALDAYRGLPGNGVNVWVELRSEFVGLRVYRPLPPALGGGEPDEPADRATLLRDDYRTRPPCAKLLMRRTHALASYLTMIYVAHAEAADGNPGRANRHANATRVNNQDSWAVLCGRWAPNIRARRARITRDLEELLAAELVGVKTKGAQGRYECFGLLSDDGTGRPYQLPRSTSDAATLGLPAAFFAQGWHLVLTPAEIGVLLIVRHAVRTQSGSTDVPGAPITRMKRWQVYGISGEAYSAIHELQEFGLLVIHDTMPNRRRGKLRTPPPEQRAALEEAGELGRSRSWQSGVTDGLLLRELWDFGERFSLEWEALANARVNRGTHAPGNAHFGRQGGNLSWSCREYGAEGHSLFYRPESVGGVAGDRPAWRAAGIPGEPRRHRRREVAEAP